MQPYMTLSADVLIVGGGSAGVMAAIRAKQMDPGSGSSCLKKETCSIPGASPAAWMP